jgi:hypothetical protein
MGGEEKNAKEKIRMLGNRFKHTWEEQVNHSIACTALRRCVLLFGAQKVERGKEFLRESLSRLSKVEGGKEFLRESLGAQKVEGGKEFLCEMFLAVANRFATAGAIHADLIGILYARFICPHAVSIPHKDK